MDENAACITRVKIDLAQYHIGTDGNPCSLELLGIVPNRGSVTRGHAIFASSRLSLRSHRRHLPGHDPVVIRDVAKGSPAAASQQLHQCKGRSVGVHMTHIKRTLVVWLN